MPVNPNELNALKKKLNEIDKKVDTVSFLAFSYIQAILTILNAKELITPEEFKAFLEKSREDLLKMGQEAQFQDMMKDILPDDKKNPES